MMEAVLSLVQVSSKSERRVSSLDSLSFFSPSNSDLILFTMSLKSSKMASSVSSLDFFSYWIISTILEPSSFALLIKVLSISSL